MFRRTTLLSILRVTLLVSVFSVVAVLWLGHRAHAYSERILDNLGQHMMQYAGAYHQNTPQEIQINGAQFLVSTGSVEASVSEVLDQFHAKCLEKNGKLHEQWAQLAKKRHIKLPDNAGLFDGVYRANAKETGTVVCAETGDSQLPPEILLSRITAVLKTGDISKLGHMRYAHVMKGQDRTVFVALWTEGTLNFKTMFPRDRDAPGVDVPGIPRPKDSRRILSTQPKGHDVSVNMYSAKTNAAGLQKFYAEQLPNAGFTLLTKPGPLMAANDGKRMLTISLRDDSSTGHGVATIATQPD